jgi:hypothetical protein
MPTATATAPREQALALLQAIDRHGAYTDAASAADDRSPCTLAEAIRSTAALIEGAMPAGNVPQELADLFSSLAAWAWDQEHSRYVTGYREGHDRGTAEAYRVAC